MTIRLLYPVGNDEAGAVIRVSDDRARRLLLTGYAERVDPPTVEVTKKKAKKE